MAKRPRYSRWRRLPRVYRSGEFKLPESKDEPRRVSLYLRDAVLDAAELQAARAGFETVQDYCAELLSKTIEAEHVREQVAEVEAKRGPLEGLQEIANDPEYLVEWSSRSESGPGPGAVSGPRAQESVPEIEVTLPIVGEPGRWEPSPSDSGVLQPVVALSDAALVVLHHAGQAGDDPSGFLPSLRRGTSASMNEVAELAQALQTLEAETRHVGALDRRLVFALHRLAYEGQILHTDAWPGVFDAWTVDTLHAVQEAVERILSGQDIRYFPTNP